MLDTLSDVPESIADRAHSLRGETLNVYRTMANNVDLLEAFQTYGSVVWDETGLTAQEREFVILSVAYHTGSVYEWHQHVRVALDEGLTPREIGAISSGDVDQFDASIGAIVDYTERFVRGSVDDPTHQRLSTYYTDEIVLGISMLAGNYLGISCVLDTL